MGRFRNLSTCAILIEQKPPLKIWLDTGTAEPGWEQARELRQSSCSKKAGSFRRIFNTWKPKAPITAKRLGLHGSNRRYGFCFHQQNRHSHFPTGGTGGGFGGKWLRRRRWELVESAQAVMGFWHQWFLLENRLYCNHLL